MSLIKNHTQHPRSHISIPIPPIDSTINKPELMYQSLNDSIK